MTLIRRLTPKQLRPYQAPTPQCSRKVEEMWAEPSQFETKYRMDKSKKTGLDPTCCSKRSKYEIYGRPLCAFHAGIEALDILMEQAK